MRTGSLARSAPAFFALLLLSGCSSCDSGPSGLNGPHGPSGPSGPSGPDGPDGPDGLHIEDASVVNQNGDASVVVPLARGDAGSPPYFVPPVVLTSFDLPEGPAKRGLAWNKYRKALRAVRRERPDEAVALLNEALGLDVGYTLAYSALGVVHLRAKRYDLCVEVSQQCVQRAFDSERLGACYYNLGKCLEHLDHNENALQAYRHSLEFRDNEITEAALRGLANRSGHKGTLTIERERRAELVKSASSYFLRRTCKQGRVTSDERLGVFSCGSLTVWGSTGSFSKAEATEVLLAVSDQNMSRKKGRGFGVLLRKEGRRWLELAKTPLLAPGEGGVDFEGSIRLSDGSEQAVVQTSDCHEGCCRGSLQALSARELEDTVTVTGRKLLVVGIRNKSVDQPSKRALITGVRQIDGNGDGVSGLLFRYETREGKANPSISYLRLERAGETLEVRGQLPPISSVPRCAQEMQ